MDELITVTVHNDGPLVKDTDYWESEMCRQGLLYNTLNAWALRILLPDEKILEDIGNPRIVTIYRGPCPEKGGGDLMEVVLDDDTAYPYTMQTGLGQWDRRFAETDEGKPIRCLVYTKGPSLRLDLPATYRRVPYLPWRKLSRDQNQNKVAPPNDSKGSDQTETVVTEQPDTAGPSTSNTSPVDLDISRENFEGGRGLISELVPGRCTSCPIKHRCPIGETRLMKWAERVHRKIMSLTYEEFTAIKDSSIWRDPLSTMVVDLFVSEDITRGVLVSRQEMERSHLSGCLVLIVAIISLLPAYPEMIRLLECFPLAFRSYGYRDGACGVTDNERNQP